MSPTGQAFVARFRIIRRHRHLEEIATSRYGLRAKHGSRHF
jgi:hypothetical protein